LLPGVRSNRNAAPPAGLTLLRRVAVNPRDLFSARRDPYHEGDTSLYHTSKEIANTAPNGIAYLHFVHGGTP
jgi:hypothetical protein